MIRWKRVLRTAASERYIAVRDGHDVAQVDLHFLGGRAVSGTVVLFRDRAAGDGGWSEDQVPDLLASLDEDFLPDVDLAHGTLAYTVILGDVLGRFEAESASVKPRRR